MRRICQALCITSPLLSVSGAAISSTVSETASTTQSTLVISAATASASVIPLSSSLPSQLPLPQTQEWCPSQIFCAGHILQTLNLAQLYEDPKTIVDKPTSRTAHMVLADYDVHFGNSTHSSHPPTVGDILDFELQNFAAEGQELAAVTLSSFSPEPEFLSRVKDKVVQAWSKTVHGYWAQLIRNTNRAKVCKTGECESSLIPLNHTFVVPGGRFREQYYWDSFWIVEGLLRSELYTVANSTLQNFMDELENFGFIPNGGRIYYLNRSQPPLFIHMLSAYVNTTNDTSILARALPLAERELQWWGEHRSVHVLSENQKTYKLYRFAVNNTAPRPESYLQDYHAASDVSLPVLNETQRSDLYAELASGAETGWSYSSRWFASPEAEGNAALRSLQVTRTVPVDLNSIIYHAYVLLAGLYDKTQDTSARTKASSLRATAGEMKQAIFDIFWDDSKLAFFDYILSSPPSPIIPSSDNTPSAGTRSTLFSAAHYYPFWAGIIPPSILSHPSKAFGAFSSLNLVLQRYNGTLPATFRTTGQQWDAPNAWPPHQYIALQALRSLPKNLTSASWSDITRSKSSSFELIPPGQLGLAEQDLPTQPLLYGEARRSGAMADINALNGTVVNGGAAVQGEGWGAAMQRALANRYVTSALCSWRATGGSIEGVLERLGEKELEATKSANGTGNMFDKFSALDVDSAGAGGEYTVQAGFGWTNGVVLWVADVYGDVLVQPECPDFVASAQAEGVPVSAARPLGTVVGTGWVLACMVVGGLALF